MSQEKTTTQRQRDALVFRIERYFADRKREKLGFRATADTLGVRYSTLRRRMIYPGTFTLAELQRVAEGIGIPLPELLREEESHHDDAESVE